MRRMVVRKMLCVAAVAALSGCGSNTGPEVNLERALVNGPIEVTLQHGEDRFVAGTLIRISFEAVLEDSRCATDVVCVWEGNASVQVGIGAGTGPTHALQLNTSLEPQSGEWNGVVVTLLEVTPSPTSDSTIPAGDYAVTLRLEPS